MEEYTIYCTEEQTKKAFELGAPLNTWGFARELVTPTAEQVIGWLEEQGLSFHIMQPYNNKTDFWLFTIRPSFEKGTNFSSRKEATLAAIDVAMDYLINKKVR